MNNNDGNNSNLKEAIIKVVAFFDMFDYPLTVNEIWQNINVKCELSEVMEAVEKYGSIVESKNGFYFLVGRDGVVEKRLKHYNFTDRKFKRAMLVSKIFRFIPWIKMIAVSNLLGAHNLKNDSDIDFFIVTEKKRIWLTRFFCAGVTKFLGLRPQANNSRDKICLSFYVSEKAMDLSSLTLVDAGRPQADIYFIYWLAGLTPLYDVDDTYEKIIKANQWLRVSLPNWPAFAFASADKQPEFWSKRRDVGSPLPRFYRDVVDLFFGGLEPQFKKLQLRLLPPQLKNLMNLDSRVVINDQIIKLHANDRREEYGERYLEKINNLL